MRAFTLVPSPCHSLDLVGCNSPLSRVFGRFSVRVLAFIMLLYGCRSSCLAPAGVRTRIELARGLQSYLPDPTVPTMLLQPESVDLSALGTIRLRHSGAE